ncbi:unnamed protein product [Ostreobium quekettii]|uniref:Ubiquitin-like domain-containing protein n=1 Tax=Ostreobium quekettii TaxID=121088 RepID=A0A8S1J2D6_9CHLO|nr:unnamed protein product [Ostreobium quekettii]|eukprot:evm.model.scf_1774.4 EVM.evm.TU.scf_1774.4   scf_1774:18693-21764(+)
MASMAGGGSKLGDRGRLQSVEINSEDLDEVESLYDAAEPCYAVVYRTRQSEGTPHSSGGEGGVRVVSCIKAEIEERFSRRIFGRLEDFVTAVTYLVDEDERERSHALELPSCLVFDCAPNAATARAVLQDNRTLIRHFAPVLDVDPSMSLLYERQLFKIRCGPRSAGHAERREARGRPSRGAFDLTSSADELGGPDRGPGRGAARRHRREADPDGMPGGHDGSHEGWAARAGSPYDGDGGRGEAESNPPVAMQRTRSLGDRSREGEDGGKGEGAFVYSTMPVDPFPWQGVMDHEDRKHGRSPRYGAPQDDDHHQQHLQEPASGKHGSHHREAKTGLVESRNPAHERRRMQDSDDFDGLSYHGKPRYGGISDQAARHGWQDGHRKGDGRQHQDEYQEAKSPQYAGQQGGYTYGSAGEQHRQHERAPPKGYPLSGRDGGYREDVKQYGQAVEPRPSSPSMYKRDGRKTGSQHSPDSIPPLKSIQSLNPGRGQDWHGGQDHQGSQGHDLDSAVVAPEPEKASKSKFTMEVDPRETVGSLKQKIYKARGYHPNVQRLVFDGTILSDKMRLADCNVTEDSTLVLWLLLGKGRAVRVM